MFAFDYMCLAESWKLERFARAFLAGFQETGGVQWVGRESHVSEGDCQDGSGELSHVVGTQEGKRQSAPLEMSRRRHDSCR